MGRVGVGLRGGAGAGPRRALRAGGGARRARRPGETPVRGAGADVRAARGRGSLRRTPGRLHAGSGRARARGARRRGGARLRAAGPLVRRARRAGRLPRHVLLVGGRLEVRAQPAGPGGEAPAPGGRAAGLLGVSGDADGPRRGGAPGAAPRAAATDARGPAAPGTLRRRFPRRRGGVPLLQVVLPAPLARARPGRGGSGQPRGAVAGAHDLPLVAPGTPSARSRPRVGRRGVAGLRRGPGCGQPAADSPRAPLRPRPGRTAGRQGRRRPQRARGPHLGLGALGVAGVLPRRPARGEPQLQGDERAHHPADEHLAAPRHPRDLCGRRPVAGDPRRGPGGTPGVRRGRAQRGPPRLQGLQRVARPRLPVGARRRLEDTHTLRTQGCEGADGARETE